MAASSSSSSSSLSSENEAKIIIHPLQTEIVPGPKGAYEVRETKEGLYVRVDMPGVPPEGFKLVKYPKFRRVTFTGKAPKIWAFDSSERVYGGYVSLNQDPDDLDFWVTFVNGCLRMFFPGAKGTLHCLPSNNRPQNFGTADHQQENSGVWIFMPCDTRSMQLSNKPNVSIGSVTMVRHHSRDCSCCKEDPKAYITVSTCQEIPHINPYMLNGTEGLCETKVVEDEKGTRLFMRVDMPGLGDKEYFVAVRDQTYLFFGGEGQKDCHLDEGGRTYHGCVILRCSCCKIVGVHHEMKHGVLRIMFKKHKI